MNKLSILLAPTWLVLAAALAIAACDNNIPPTKAPGADQNPQVDPAPNATPGDDQPAAPPAQ
ncbi:MAG: hypothetical protein E5Y10_12765 [Mesorhizobium sp.]|uniref:hypothetical protein n=1 Tax=Mesorhizobium sp. TaxID=1871066 RepID=UPI000FE5CC80|nr:hypothetical protein [Mesorhizobium sp.]RWO47268.1 MAG: hypothetical protein EOS13_26485 [Mesorhizobium sp.]TIN39781.1 MAG: hypothetical protein E5Y13_13145 [Mesorhizobium sp.]TJU90492.1 MAG: hypothetical protein E5Y10_12765 [Mesorhizobium sp.]